MNHTTVPSPVGDLLVLADETSLRGLWFANHSWSVDDERLGDRVAAGDHPVLRRTAAQLAEYFAGERRDFDVPVAFAGKPFDEWIWSRLQSIGYGETVSYGALAVELGDRSLAQQVGQSVGHNPISIVIPCHRVIGADGSLVGFGGGLDRKRLLLTLEEPAAVDAGRLF